MSNSEAVIALNAATENGAVDTSVSDLQTLAELYLSTPLAQHDQGQLARWQPLENSLWRRVQPLMSWQAKARVRSVTVDSHQLAYWEAGNPAAPTLLLLHGFGSSKENWSFLTAKLSRQFHVLAPDLPGFGISSFLADSDYSLARQADRIAEFLKVLNVGKVFVVGSSMGGAIASQLAARHSERVDALCLMNSAGSPGSRLSLLESGLGAGVNYLSPARPVDTARVFDIALHRRHRLLGRGLAFLLASEMSHRKPVNDFLFTQLVNSLLSVWQGLETITAPTLVLWGDSDQVLDVTCAEGFKRKIQGARVMVMPGTGHLPMLEEPQLSAQVLRDFWTATSR